MRDQAKDEQWIRERVAEKLAETVYVMPNHYDGGYEVRAGTLDFFVDYESIDANDTALIYTHLAHV